MKVLVAGGSGLIGNAVAEALVGRGADVVCLSRSGEAENGVGLRGDVRLPDLGLGSRGVEELRDGLTHVVSCFGSVDVVAGPRLALGTHLEGTRNVLRLASSSADIERVLHVSSVLALGRTDRRVGNGDFHVGQRFRSWYEFGKFLAEREARAFADAPVRVLRIGDTLGDDRSFARSVGPGLGSVLMASLRGYPFYVQNGGRFPVYASDVSATAEMAVRGLTTSSSASTWTWFDPALPTLADVLVGLCAAWGIVPRILRARRSKPIARMLAPGLGIPQALFSYSEPWVDIDPSVLAELPGDLPACPDDYIEAAGRALRRHASELGIAA